MTVVEAIKSYVTEHGYPPSVRDLAAMLGVGVATTQHRLRKAQEAGEIDWVPGKPRTLTIREEA